jgi:protein tyrosine/serine phosphatase
MPRNRGFSRYIYKIEMKSCCWFLLSFLLLPVGLRAGNHGGIQRFERVNENVYRGGQPSIDGFKALAKAGFKTIVDLRSSADEAGKEKQTVEALGMQFVSIPMKMRAPADEQIAKVISLFTSATKGPVFVHCHGGRDRTGTAVACYRISHDGWSNDAALREAFKRGLRPLFGMDDYILKYRSPAPAPAASQQ